MSALSKHLGKKCGPARRLFYALVVLFAPGALLVAVVKAFLSAVEGLDDEELLSLVAEIQND